LTRLSLIVDWTCADAWVQNIKEGIEGKPVDWYADVFELVFPDVDESQVNGLWKKELKKPPKEEAEEESESSLIN
jgi:ATP-dependent Lon protease